VKVTEKNIKLCEGNRCAAALLLLFPGGEWVRKTIPEIQSDLGNFFDEESIKESLDWLISKKHIENEGNFYKNLECQTPTVTNRDLIALLGKALLDAGAGIPQAKAYALAGRLYNKYDYIPAEKAIQALTRKQGKVFDPVAYLFGVAKKEAKRMKGEVAAASEEKNRRITNQPICNLVLARRIKELTCVWKREKWYSGLPVQGNVPNDFKSYRGGNKSCL
jgi:hypothetical protein